MTIIFKIVTIAVVYLILSSMLKEYRNEYVLLLRFAVSIIIILIVTDTIYGLITKFFSIFEIFNIDSEHINTLLKVAGISIVTDYIFDSLIDSGETSIARLVSIGSKLLIIGLSIPMLNSLIILCVEMLK